MASGSFEPTVTVLRGPYDGRPDPAYTGVGTIYFDTDWGKPVWWAGDAIGWVFADGTVSNTPPV